MSFRIRCQGQRINDTIFSNTNNTNNICFSELIIQMVKKIVLILSRGYFTEHRNTVEILDFLIQDSNIYIM